MIPSGYDASVFINCPFDKKYEPILQAILFTTVALGFTPRVATERSDSGENRIDKIRELIEASRYSIHDLSRCQAAKKGEFSRLNMPFELGVDYGCRHYMEGRSSKRTLILEEKPYRYQAALSDLAGADIKHHGGDYSAAMLQVRNWFANGDASKSIPPPSKLEGYYIDFQAWNYQRLSAEGWTDDEIQVYQTSELLAAMIRWMGEGCPSSWPTS